MAHPLKPPGRFSARAFLLITILLVILYVGGAAGLYLLDLRRDNRATVHAVLPISPGLQAGQRILIFSPHPDDETLGCGGLIQLAKASGAFIKVVFLTNGDGFRVAVERQYRSLKLTPDHYLRFAALRKEETIKALRILGMSAEDIIWFGYPDGGLLPMWKDHWTAAMPYRSPNTGVTRSPYSWSFSKFAPYCGESVLRDVEEVIRTWKPTQVYVTHPSDDHKDHTAASSFVNLALQHLSMPGAVMPELRYYLVHRGDWPLPQGLYATDVLSPPIELSRIDTKWTARKLNQVQTSRKLNAILAYESQTSITKRFLVSFARSTEPEGLLNTPTLPSIAGQAPHVGTAMDWSRVEPIILDSVNDSLLRDFQGAGDIRAISGCRDSQRLHFRIEMNKAISRQTDVRLFLRTFRIGKRGLQSTVELIRTAKSGKRFGPDIESAVHDRVWELSLPVDRLRNCVWMAVNVETDVMGIQVDRTGFRIIKVE